MPRTDRHAAPTTSCQKYCAQAQAGPLCDAPKVSGAPLRRQARVAHCVVGVAHHRYGGSNWPITNKMMYEPMARWLADLARLNVQSDVFLHLDMALWPMSFPYYRKKNWIKTMVLGGEAWREKTGETPYSALNGTIAALRPVSVTTHDRAPYCASRNCSCSQTFPRWWEQVAKNQLCYAAVARH